MTPSSCYWHNCHNVAAEGGRKGGKSKSPKKLAAAKKNLAIARAARLLKAQKRRHNRKGAK